MDIQRLITLVVFSFSAMLLWEAWQKHNAPQQAPRSATAVPAASSVPKSTAALDAPKSQGATAAQPPAAVPAAAGEPVAIHTDMMDVELGTVGGDIRKVTLLHVFSAKDQKKPLTLLEPSPQHFFVTQSGLLGEGLPSHNTVYQAEAKSYSLAPDQQQLEVRMHAQDANGVDVVKRLVFHRGSYVIDVAYDITNKTAQPLAPRAYFAFLRDANPPSEDAAQPASFGGVSTFLGPAVFTEESKFAKINFSDIEKGKQSHPKKAKDGWIAIVQHYFVSAWLPKDAVDREFVTEKLDDRYRAGVIVPVGTIAPGASSTVDVPLYVGPQEKEQLEKLAPGLNLVVDYGWLYVLAAPLFWLLKFIHNFVGNWGWSIIILTIIIKAVFYPLNAKAGRSMAQMKVLQPKMEKLKQMYGEDRQKLNTAMMELYRTEKINPLGGCLPILVQIPVFIALYWVLLASIELRHAPWIGWIHDLSAADPYYILPIVYAVSMLVQTRLNPQPADPVQARVMLIMPIAFSIFFVFFPSGLVLYWVSQNLLSIVQQWHINRTLAAEAKAHKGR